MSRRPLVVAAHGTASGEGRKVVEGCAAAAAAELGVAHAVGYVDVCGPTLEEVLASEGSAGAGPVVVPYFLASGYHVRQDVPGAVAEVAGALVTPALGVEPEVVDALADRVLEVLPDADGVVVTAAGSSVDSARAEVALVADLLGERLGVPTRTAYLSGPGPRPASEVSSLREVGCHRVALAAHLLAPGHFLDRAHAAALDLGRVATGPLGTHPALAALVVRRYREALDRPSPLS
ncbi:sirohydrochlorin chelatase [Ornithinimicrobium cerasi]|uniref:sirohydrochlorin chelatase n=1 Tax=Ornithinimicrobium cerasi TaxID=2248773 RepID=UPI000EFE1364|nr:CbiX/SirB N-terminal domain-containing protein [Ornithinimicrobium cerasi]